MHRLTVNKKLFHAISFINTRGFRQQLADVCVRERIIPDYPLFELAICSSIPPFPPARLPLVPQKAHMLGWRSVSWQSHSKRPGAALALSPRYKEVYQSESEDRKAEQTDYRVTQSLLYGVVFIIPGDILHSPHQAILTHRLDFCPESKGCFRVSLSRLQERTLTFSSISSHTS